MDIATFSAAYEGLRPAKNAITGLADLKIEAESLSKINDAVKKVGEAQDTLFTLREELFRLQEEKNRLKQALSQQDEWNKRVTNYELVETAGEAVVLKSKSGTPHFACPSCVEKKEIHILQDRKVWAGTFDCPGCGKSFPVKPYQQPRGRYVISDGSV